MLGSQQNLVLCANLSELVKKVILAFCEVNVTFTHRLDIYGSIHIRSDDKDVAGFILNEHSCKDDSRSETRDAEPGATVKMTRQVSNCNGLAGTNTMTLQINVADECDKLMRQENLRGHKRPSESLFSRPARSAVSRIAETSATTGEHINCYNIENPADANDGSERSQLNNQSQRDHSAQPDELQSTGNRSPTTGISSETTENHGNNMSLSGIGECGSFDDKDIDRQLSFDHNNRSSRSTPSSSSGRWDQGIANNRTGGPHNQNVRRAKMVIKTELYSDPVDVKPEPSAAEENEIIIDDDDNFHDDDQDFEQSEELGADYGKSAVEIASTCSRRQSYRYSGDSYDQQMSWNQSDKDQNQWSGGARGISGALAINSVKTCNICFKSCSSSHQLRVHMQRHHDQSFQSSIDESCQSPKGSAGFLSTLPAVVGNASMIDCGTDRMVCSECNLSFRSLDGLRCHENSKHSMNKVYNCAFCSQIFLTRQAAYTHRIKFHNIKTGTKVVNSLKFEPI